MQYLDGTAVMADPMDSKPRSQGPKNAERFALRMSICESRRLPPAMRPTLPSGVRRFRIVQRQFPIAGRRRYPRAISVRRIDPEAIQTTKYAAGNAWGPLVIVLRHGGVPPTHDAYKKRLLRSLVQPRHNRPAWLMLCQFGNDICIQQKFYSFAFRHLPLKRGTSRSESPSGERVRNSESFCDRLALASHSFTETITTAGRPCRVTICGPADWACSSRWLKSAFATATGHDCMCFIRLNS